MWTLVHAFDVSSPEPWTPRKTESGARPNKTWLREQLTAREEDNRGVGGGGGLFMSGNNSNTTTSASPGLDQNTMKWRLWGTSSSCSVQDYPISHEEEQAGEFFKPEYETLTGNKVNVYPTLYKLTQSEFRRLSKQVRELPPSGKFRGNGFKKYYTCDNGESVPVVYKSQLASSRKAFNDKGWQPYDNKYKNEPPSRCRPVGIQDRAPSRGRAATPQPPAAPRSKSASSANQRCLVSRNPSPPPSNHRILTSTERSRQAFIKSLSDRSKQIDGLQPSHTYLLTGKGTSIPSGETTPGSLSLRRTTQKHAFDTLTPEVAYTLSDGVQSELYFGDKPGYQDDDTEGVWANNTSSSSLEMHDDNEKSKKRKSKPSSDSSKDEDDAVSSTSGVVSDRDSDDDSGEEANEPKLENINMDDLPTFNLRPEKLDHIYIPEYVKGDRRKYDFDVTNTYIPDYEFSKPLSEEMQNIDLRDLASKEHHWRHYTDKKPIDEIESNIIDRLIELERLQNKTEEWEQAKKEKIIRFARLREAKNKIGSTVRHQSAKLRERKCCNDCLQVCCIGDCNIPPPKDNSLCKFCEENHPPGSCSENVYTNRTRSDRVSLDDDPPKPQPKVRPKSCNSCQRLTSAKLINANNTILGRPKSGHQTFTRGQSNAKQPTRSASMSQITPEIERELWKLGINPQSVLRQEPVTPPSQPERPSTACSMTTKGRAGISPGKSYFSQRRTSLTDIAKSTRRVKSAISRTKNNNKRPKTAS